MTRSSWQDLPARLAATWTPTEEDLRFHTDEPVSMHTSWNDLRTTLARLVWSAALSEEPKPFTDQSIAIRYLSSVVFPYPALDSHSTLLCRWITERRFGVENTVVPVLTGPARTGKTTTAVVAAALSNDCDFQQTERILSPASKSMPATRNSPIPMIIMRGRQAKNRDMLVSGLDFCRHTTVKSEGAGDLQKRLLDQAARSGTRLILIDNEHGIQNTQEKSTFFRDTIQASTALVVLTRVDSRKPRRRQGTGEPSIDPSEEQILERQYELWFNAVRHEKTRHAVMAKALKMCRVQLPDAKQTARIVQSIYAVADGFPARMFDTLKSAAKASYLQNDGKLTIDLVHEVAARGAQTPDAMAS